MTEKKRIWFVIGLIILFGGLNLTILLSHLSRYFGILLIAMGLAILFFSGRNLLEAGPVDKKERPKNLGARWIQMFTFGGLLRPYFPVLGIALAVFVVYFNATISGTDWLGSNDYITLILAGTLVAYNYIPKKYWIERDFALIFMALLFLIVALPTTLYSVVYSGTLNGDSITDNTVTKILLTGPTAWLSQLLGVEFSHIGNNVLIFEGRGETVNLVINISCTGLYSVAIFVSAFVAFVSVEYSRFDRKVGKLLALGIFLAWIANIIRMAIIVLVGKHRSAGAMDWTHNNIGEIIFMIWVSIFWLLMFRYLNVWDDIDTGTTGKKKGPAVYEARRVAVPKREGTESEGMKHEGTKRAARTCPLCGVALSSTIPAYRCQCGQIYHQDCTLGGGECVKCGKKFTKR